MIPAPLVVSGCVVYDETLVSVDTAESGLDEDPHWEQPETEGDLLAWLQPDFAVLGSTEIVGLFGEFDPSSVEAVTLSGPGEISVLAATVRDDEYLMTVDLRSLKTKPGTYDSFIWFSDGSAYFVPAIFEVVEPPKQ